MDQKTIREMLPVLVAFAHGLRIQFRDLRRDGFYEDQGWLDINPETTEFRLGDDTNPQEWRVKPGQPVILIRSADQEVVVGILPEEGSGADPSMEDEDLVGDLKRKADERHRRAKQWLGVQDPPIIDDPTAPHADCLECSKQLKEAEGPGSGLQSTVMEFEKAPDNELVIDLNDPVKKDE